MVILDTSLEQVVHAASRAVAVTLGKEESETPVRVTSASSSLLQLYEKLSRRSKALGGIDVPLQH
jgi:hypothetical protein